MDSQFTYWLVNSGTWASSLGNLATGTLSGSTGSGLGTYNINGSNASAQYLVIAANDSDSGRNDASNAGFKISSVNVTTRNNVPEGGSVVAMIGASMLGLQAHLRRHLASLPAPSADTAPIETSDHRSALRGFLRRQAPNSLYHVVNAQVALWLIGWFGHAEQVAEAGALGRLAVLFGVLATVVASLVLPYFARLDSAERVRAGLLRVHAFHAALTLVLGGAALAWPGAILWVLGGHYAGLQAELAWMVLASALTAWGGTVYSIGCARDWVQPLWLSAPAGLLATAVTALLVDVGTVRGSLLVQVASAAVALLVSSAYLAAKARQPLPSHVPTGAGYA